jgi:endo-1,4-beta-mannosidase
MLKNMQKLISFFLLVCAFNASALDNFITRDGHRLFDGNDTFRFAGIHAPELHRIEDDARGKCSADIRGWGQYFKWPTAQEQENWIKTLSGLGHKAMRIYVLSIEQSSDKLCGRETHISAPIINNGMPRLNEKAMQVYDRMIALADKHQLRLILPFIDHWEWWGGRKQLAAFYNESEDAFYDVNSQTFKAYLDIIRQVITRKNTITGQYYYEEKAIMAWETGNELKHTNQAFLIQTAAHIKSLAPNQLVVDGTYLQINQYALNDPNVDIISNHFYTTNDNNKPQTIKDDLAKIAGKKAYLLGEFGLEKHEVLQDIMNTAVHYEFNGSKTVGAFIWGFRGHRHNGGFYFHKEYTGHYSYRFPGFSEADSNDELTIVNIVRNAIAEMNGQITPPHLPVPESPIMRPIVDLDDIRWMGSPLARTYRVERKENESGKWQTIGENISDGKLEFDPKSDRLFSDTSLPKSKSVYFYRVTAKNESGESAPSNEVSLSVSSNTQASFVRVQDGQFIWQGKPYYFTGANYWFGPLLGSSEKGLERMRRELDQLKANGIDNLRILVGGDGGGHPQMVKPALQFEQGKYNEQLFIGLDHLMVEMRKRDMLAVLYLNNNWIWSGGMAQYLQWNGYGEIPNPFLEDYTWDQYMVYTQQFHQCEPCKKAFAKHVEKVITRINSISNEKYTDDPTIMSWQVANEPRVFAEQNEKHFTDWINSVVAQIDALAPKQLISTGSEGLAGSAKKIDIYQRVHSNPKIDYLTMHVWPKNWSWYDADNEAESTLTAIRNAQDYIDIHLRVANQLSKPIVLSEFGFPRDKEALSARQSTQYRNQFYQAIFDIVVKNKLSSGVFAGTNVWGFAGIGKPGESYVADPPQEPQGLNSVFSSDADTLDLIKSANIKLERVNH